MLPVQMADNSFDYNESGMVKSVKSENSKDRKNFTDLYESVSSTLSKSEGNDVKEDRVLKKKNLEKSSEISLKMPSIMSDEENVKLIGIKKGKPLNLAKKIKTANSRALREKLTDLSLVEKPDRPMPGKVSKESIIPDQEIQNIHRDDIAKSVASGNAADSSEIPVSEQSGLSVAISPVNEEKSEKSIRKSGEKSAEKSTVKNEMSGKQAKLSVLDLRESRPGLSKIEQTKTRQTVSKVAMESQKLPSDQLDQIRFDSTEAAKPIVVELTHVKDNFSGESKTLTTTTGSALMKQLEESVNNKIVKQSSIILKDGNSGEIKLILKPEALGKVRIRLSLTDNRIAGKIIVESAAVKEIFEQNLQNLERAFKENGFDTAALNVSVGGDGTGLGNREKNGDIEKQIEIIEEIIPTMITESENLIDLIA